MWSDLFRGTVARTGGGLEPSRVPSRRLVAGCALLAGSCLSSAVGAARVEIVLDASGSMRGAAGGTSKMEAAKQAVRTTVQALDSSAVVALRLYGHRLPSEPKEPSCADTELVIPFGPLDRASFVAAVDGARPLGQTPLAHSLELAAADFGQLGDEPAAVILVSDGEESCGGDPAAVACAFAGRGIDLTVHTVGFDVDAAARAQLQAVAQCTGGEYRDAKNASELSESLRQLTQAGLLVDKEREAVGQEIRGGNGFDSAVPIEPGTYHLDHHQRPGEFDYFSIEVSPGHVLRVSQVSYEVGVEIRGDTFREGFGSAGMTNWSASGVAIHGPDRGRISSMEGRQAGDEAVASALVLAGGGGRYYVTIGHTNTVFGGIHKSSPIAIELIDQTDAGSGTDAGSTDREAVTVEPGEHRGWLHAVDWSNTDQDVLGFDAESGATYTVRARPDEDVFVLSASVADEDGVQLASGKAPNAGAAVRLEGIVPERSGRLFVTLGARTENSRSSPYSFELTSTGGSALDSPTAVTPTGADDVEEADTPTEDAAGGGSPLDRLPGGLLACGVLLAIAALVVVALVVGLVVVLRRRSAGPR